jgi:transposase
MSEHRDLTDGEWRIIDPLIPKPNLRQDGRGRPWKPHRDVLNGILYVLRTGAAWASLPHSYPPYQTCHRRFQQWAQSGVMQKIMQALGEEMLVQRCHRKERRAGDAFNAAAPDHLVFENRVA